MLRCFKNLIWYNKIALQYYKINDKYILDVNWQMSYLLNSNKINHIFD